MGAVLIVDRLVVSDLTPKEAVVFENRGTSWTIDDVDDGVRYLGCRVARRTEFAGKVTLWFEFLRKCNIPAEAGIEVSLDHFQPESSA